MGGDRAHISLDKTLQIKFEPGSMSQILSANALTTSTLQTAFWMVRRLTCLDMVRDR